MLECKYCQRELIGDYSKKIRTCWTCSNDKDVSLIQNRYGKKHGRKGIYIRIVDTDHKSKTITVHGYTLQEIYDEIKRIYCQKEAMNRS